MALGGRFESALVFAAELHREQRRKLGGAPYVAHLLSVCGLVLEHGGGEDEAIAALLHDAVEDQGGSRTLAAIRTRYGERVAELVACLSDTDRRPKPPWRQRKEAHIERLAAAPEGAVRIALADKVDNLRSLLSWRRRLGEAVWEAFNGGREGTLWYHREVLRVLRPRAPQDAQPLVAELERLIDELEAQAM